MTVMLVRCRIVRTSYQLAVTLLGIAVAAARPSIAQTSPIAVRELGAAQTVSLKTFGLILQIHAFPDGRVVVNDGGARRLVLLNKTLAEESVLLDSLSGESNFYGPRATPIIRYTGDSALFVDGRSSTLLLISPAGKIARVVSVPRPTDMIWLASSASGTDASGNLVYRGRIPQTRPGSEGPAAQAALVTRMELQTPDSLPIVRANFDTRLIDTIARLAWPTDKKSDIRSVGGKSIQTIFHNPLLAYDEWVVTSDGSIAIVHGDAYRIELIDADGKRIADAKLPFDWRSISDADKQQLVDSARAVFDTSASRNAGASTMSSRTPSGGSIGLRSPLNASAVPPAPPTHLWITPDEMLNYWPSIRPGAVTADLDGNVWILPTTSSVATNGALVYDVVNNKGVLAYRVRLPVGRVVAGFGRGGVIYTSVKQDTSGWILEQRRIR